MTPQASAMMVKIISAMKDADIEPPKDITILMRDLEPDSLNFLEFTMILEEETGLALTDEDVTTYKNKSFQEFCDFMIRKAV